MLAASPAPRRLPPTFRNLRRGLEAVKRSQRVYLEAYTSLLLVPKEKLVGGVGPMMKQARAPPVLVGVWHPLLHACTGIHLRLQTDFTLCLLSAGRRRSFTARR